MKDAVKKAIIRWYLSTSKTNDGGPGSGNFNHSGRPGEVGGSGKGGGAQSEGSGKWTGNDNGKLHEGSRARDYHNDHADPAMRQWFKDHAKDYQYNARWRDGSRKTCARFGTQIGDEIRERFRLRKKAKEAEFNAPQTEDIYDVLRDIRPFGASVDSEHFEIQSDLDEDRTREIVEEAASRFPTEWLESGKTRIYIHDTWGRANFMPGYQFRDGIGVINVFARENPKIVKDLNLPDDRISDVGIANTLAHEFGHACEYNNSEVRQWAQDYLEARTKGKEHSFNINGEEEIPDSFFKSYMGRQYTDGSTEITSVLVQSLGYFNPVDQFYGKEMFYERDPESFRFILGMLALAGGGDSW